MTDDFIKSVSGGKIKKMNDELAKKVNEYINNKLLNFNNFPKLV